MSPAGGGRGLQGCPPGRAGLDAPGAASDQWRSAVPASVEFCPLFDPILDRVGFPLDHPYVERVYCSVLGPSSVLLLRRAGELFNEHPRGVEVDLVELSRSLGLGAPSDADDVGRHSPLRRTMDRLVRFRMASWLDDARLGVHPKVPALERHRAARLPETVQTAHHQLLTDHLKGLVARAEGREVVPPALDAVGAVRAGSELPEPQVAARLRAFGNNGLDPRIAAR